MSLPNLSTSPTNFSGKEEVPEKFPDALEDLIPDIISSEDDLDIFIANEEVEEEDQAASTI